MPERRSGARKFRPGAFWLQNYWISQREPISWVQQVSSLRYSNPLVNKSFKFHIIYDHKFTVLNVFTKCYKIEKKPTWNHA